MGASLPCRGRLGVGGGPSRADGIKVPRWKSKLFAGEPEGPRLVIWLPVAVRVKPLSPDAEGGSLRTTLRGDGCDRHDPRTGAQINARSVDRIEVMPQGRAGMRRGWPKPSHGSPSVCPMVVGNSGRGWPAWTGRSAERRIDVWHRGMPTASDRGDPRRGRLTATAAVAAISGCLPVGARAGPSAGEMLGISGICEPCSSTAPAVLTNSKTPPEWAVRLAERRPAKRWRWPTRRRHDLGPAGPTACIRRTSFVSP